jgi:hypothetical protein
MITKGTKHVETIIIKIVRKSNGTPVNLYSKIIKISLKSNINIIDKKLKYANARILSFVIDNPVKFTASSYVSSQNDNKRFLVFSDFGIRKEQCISAKFAAFKNHEA